MAIPTYVPLIISLIALVVPVLNLLRILFETADGYRKCSEAVIGPWSKLRWRRWSWSEFRFEVHFVTPKLELQDISKARVKEASYRECFLALPDRVPKKQEGEADDTNPRSAGNKSPQPWYRRISTQHWKFFDSAKRDHALAQSGYVLDTSLTTDFDNRIINMKRRSTLSAPCGDEESEQGNASSVKHRFVSDQRVSWLSFLRHLHRVQNRMASNSQPPSGLGLGPGQAGSLPTPQPPSDLGPDPWASLLDNPKCANLDLLKSRHPTGVSVSFVEWTWDSLPAKATRPMATTMLGTLVIMAARLGMQWRIDLEKDTFQASGNGYSLSCTQAPEMGLVATFTAEEKDHRRSPYALAFNNPTDKLMCGIIPGATILVDEDFYCTDDLGKTEVLNVVLNAIDRSGWLRQHLDLQPEGSDKDQTRWTDMLSNEITALLCEFLPQEGAKDHIFSGWKEGINGLAVCPLNSPQFLNVFLAYLDPYSESRSSREHSHVLDQVSKLAKLIAEDDDEQSTQYAQRIFERTTIYLISNGFGKEHHGQKLYLHLVAAHCGLSSSAWETTLSYLRNPKILRKETKNGWELHYEQVEVSIPYGQDLPKEAEEGERDNKAKTFYLNRTGEVFSWQGEPAPFEVEAEVFARKYLQEAEKIFNYRMPDALMEYFRGVNCRMEKETCRDAWLVMMLRGIAWFAVKNKRGKLAPARSGSAIPSSLWDNQRPVWMI
jgi:hypothetical protein